MRQWNSIRNGPRRSFGFAAGLLAVLGIAGTAGAETTYSLDVTIARDGVAIFHEEVVRDDFAGSLAFEDLGAIPTSAEIDAYHRTPQEQLFSVDSPTALGNLPLVVPADVVAFDGGLYSLEFDASALGLPQGANVDAVSREGSLLILSFDTTVDLPGGVVVADEDLAAFDGTNFSLHVDTSTLGIDRALDLDGVDAQGAGAFRVSFDTSGSVAGIDFDDDTILKLAGGQWSAEADLSSVDVAAAAADIVALPEPGIASMGLVGIVTLLVLRRRRFGTSLALLLALPWASPAIAGDGVREISQVCATQTGCFAGDAPGFPVTIGETGSYRLTSVLDATAASGNAVEIIADDVVLDLAGFAVRGAAITDTGTGGFGSAATLRNGFVDGAGVLFFNRGGRVEDVTVIAPPTAGIWLGSHSIARGNVIQCVGSCTTSTGIRLRQSSDATENVILGFGTGIDCAGTGATDGCLIQRNVIGEGARNGVIANVGSTVVNNVVHAPGFTSVSGEGLRVEGNDLVGFVDIQESQLIGNVIHGNSSLAMFCNDTLYQANAFVDNNGGNANAQFSLGSCISFQTNVCGDDISCP